MHWATHPPIRVEEREGQVVHDFVVMVVPVLGVLVTLHTSSKAIDAQVKIGADGALDPDHIADVP